MSSPNSSGIPPVEMILDWEGPALNAPAAGDLTTVQTQGTLKPDGTLVLDQKPTLPPGRVRVTIAPDEG